MFSFLKRDPVKALKKQHGQLLEQAMHFQRNGDMRQYAQITERAESVYQEIQKLEAGGDQ